MRIAMLGVKAVPAIGGIARYVEELASRLVARGHEVTVYCRPHYLQGEGPHRGIQRPVVRGLRGKYLDAITHTLAAVCRAVRDGFDVLHFHAVGPALLASMARRSSKAAIVVTAHGPDWEAAKWGWCGRAALSRGARAAAGHADEWIAVSNCLAGKCEALTGRRPLVIPSGTNRATAPPPEEILRLGLEPGQYVFCAARLTPEKGLHHLIDAYREIETDKRLVIAGDCPNGSTYASELHAAAGDRTMFTGYVTGRTLDELFGHAYLYCQPSTIEGLPMAVLEAMSHGRCVLASDIEPHEEALDGHGRTFRSGDSGDLARELEALLADPETVRQTGLRARRHVWEYRNWDTTAELHEQTYAQLIEGAARRETVPSPQHPEARVVG
jgi:glycosyltransferase involved in cell wall biosynthesis